MFNIMLLVITVCVFLIGFTRRSFDPSWSNIYCRVLVQRENRFVFLLNTYRQESATLMSQVFYLLLIASGDTYSLFNKVSNKVHQILIIKY